MNDINKFYHFCLAFVAVWIFLACGDTASQQSPSSELQLALIANFSASPSLAFNPPQPSLSDPDFSGDLEQIVSRMIAFKPQKIFVESVPGSASCIALNKAFQAFVFNQDLIKEYPDDVTHQVGFRIANKLKQARLFCVDVSRRLQDQHDQEALALLDVSLRNPIVQGFKDIEDTLRGYLDNGDMNDAFEFLNEDQSLFELHQLRTNLYQSQESKAAKAWSDRNEAIIENIKKDTSGLDDRVLLIFNSMNLYDLKQEIEKNSVDSRVLFFKDL
ncbi:MAG: hypothetical protein HRU09_16930 [Oligoflexales bacterium]|nr:hypothetical protein [Oligoflexales bacterium]